MLTQAEADALIAMEKRFIQLLPDTLRPGKNQTFELSGYPDTKERFFLDLWRGSIKLTKYRFQNRGRKVVILVRLELNVAPHTNPDGTRIGGTHLHLIVRDMKISGQFPCLQINSGMFRVYVRHSTISVNSAT
jgi:hypothetical protein